jgi:hypothetical protein
VYRFAKEGISVQPITASQRAGHALSGIVNTLQIPDGQVAVRQRWFGFRTTPEWSSYHPTRPVPVTDERVGYGA